MAEKPRTQKTPKGHQIPVPTEEEFEKNLDKVINPQPPYLPAPTMAVIILRSSVQRRPSGCSSSSLRAVASIRSVTFDELMSGKDGFGLTEVTRSFPAATC